MVFNKKFYAWAFTVNNLYFHKINNKFIISIYKSRRKNLIMEEQKRGLTKTQYWFVILIMISLLIILIFLTTKILNNEVEFDIECPVPLEIERCECKYTSLNDVVNKPNESIEYCYCYPYGSNITTMIQKDNYLSNLNLTLNLQTLK